MPIMVIMTPCTGDQLYPRRPTVSPNRPSLTVLIFPFGFFSYHQEYFQIINMTADYFGCKRTCVPMGKGHPEEPSGLYRKAAQHFEVLGTSRRKRGLELELAKKPFVDHNYNSFCCTNCVSRVAPSNATQCQATISNVKQR